MRRITKAAIGGLAGCALVLGGTQGASAALEAKYRFRDALTDLLTDEGPFDSAKAKITIAEKTNDTTTFRIRIRGIDPSVAGQEFSAHLHVGSCDDSQGHYKRDPAGPAAPPNEVWFGLTPNGDGMAFDQTSVDFVPVDDVVDPGLMSIVIHERVLDSTGKFPKQACFPLDVPEWAPAPSTE